MAELKKNRKALNSQRAIYKALRQVLLKKNIEDVTVTDVITECNISRTTFYRNFNNVVEPLEVMLDWFYNEYLEKRKGRENQLLFFFEYWEKHKDLIRIVTEHNMTILTNIIRNHSDDKDVFNAEVKSHLISSLLSIWSSSAKILSAKEMEEKTRELIKNNSKLNFF